MTSRHFQDEQDRAGERRESEAPVEGGPPWRVSGPVRGGLVGLSGPGPCRGYQRVVAAVFLRDWSPVK